MNNTFQCGNTIILNAEFYNENDILIDPSIVKVIIYNQSYEKIHELSDIAINKIGIGKYSCNYRTENVPQYIYYEWYAEIDGNPSLIRDKIRTVFV